MKKPFKKLINHNEATCTKRMIINQVTGMRSNLQTHFSELDHPKPSNEPIPAIHFIAHQMASKVHIGR